MRRHLILVVRAMKAIFVAAIAAIAIQPLFFYVWFLLPAVIAGESVSGHDILQMALYVLVFSAAFVLVIGIPAFLLLRRFNRATMPMLSLSGFLIALVPIMLLSWPGINSKGYSSGGNWHGKPVDYVIDGVTTIYGWLSYAESSLMFGLHGLIGAIVFYFVWRRVVGPNYAIKVTAE